MSQQLVLQFINFIHFCQPTGQGLDQIRSVGLLGGLQSQLH